MYMIGDKIYHSVYGAGIIKNIEDKYIYGNIKKYYVVNFVINDINLMIPYDYKDTKNLRKVINAVECNNVYKILTEKNTDIQEKWVDRNKLYNKCIAEGNIFSLADILKSISKLITSKNSCKSEIKTFIIILKLISSELAISMDKGCIDVQKDILNILKIDESQLL